MEPHPHTRKASDRTTGEPVKHEKSGRTVAIALIIGLGVGYFAGNSSLLYRNKTMDSITQTASSADAGSTRAQIIIAPGTLYHPPGSQTANGQSANSDGQELKNAMQAVDQKTGTEPLTEVMMDEDDVTAYPTPSADFVDKISDKTFVQGTVESREVDDKTGESSTVEILPGGERASREYRADGSLKDEEVNQNDGSVMSRSFFESGNVKVGQVQNKNGSTTSVLFDSSGVPTQMSTEYGDKSRTYNEYDDRGHILHTWHSNPDGTAQPVEAHGEGDGGDGAGSDSGTQSSVDSNG